MPVSFSSPPRNLFLLGSSGADVVTNFFHEIDKSNVSGTRDVFVPDEIRFDYANNRYNIAGTAETVSTSKEIGWIERRDYDPDLDNDPSVPSSMADWEVFIEATTAATDTTLRAMESYGNNLIVVGKTGSVPWIAKYSNGVFGGVIDWQTTTNSADVEYTGVCSDGTNYYACGNTPVTGTAQAFVEKFDSNGNPSWGKSAIMLGRDVVLEKISANSRGEVIAVGYLQDDSADKGYIVKIDTATGKILWDRTLERNISGRGGNSNDDISSANVRCTATYIDGNDQIYVVGSIDGNIPVDNGVGEFLIKYSPEGNILWQRENNTDHYTNLDGAPNMIPFDVKSDTDTQQTVVLSVQDQGSFALNNSDIFLSKYSRDGSLVFRRQISKGNNNIGAASLDADPSFYYILFRDQQINSIQGEPDRYFFGKVSTSGNGLGDFSYVDGSGTDVDYTIVANAENKIGRLSDGSVRNDASDLITYPFTANKIVFDDLATPIANKKKQMDAADSFNYSGSPAVRVTDSPELHLADEATSTTTTTTGGDPTGQAEFTTRGSYTWTAPAGVTSVCVVCIGAGGTGGAYGGSGGSLAYKNNITVVPGTSYAIEVGETNTNISGAPYSFTAESSSAFGTVASGGEGGYSGSASSTFKTIGSNYDGGGRGGLGGTDHWAPETGYKEGAGGGAGGYSGDGGNAGKTSNSGQGADGSGGGGGGGSWGSATNNSGGGGGTGIYGEGANGTGGTVGSASAAGGTGGSGGADGVNIGIGYGGQYGGGSGGGASGSPGNHNMDAQNGAVRIIWGTGRAFPSTLTADQTPSQGSTTTTTYTATDLSGNGHHSEVDGATLHADGYWEFDGVDDNITIPYTPDLAFTDAILSCEAWIYPDNLVNGGQEFSIINKRGNNSTQNTNRPYVFGVNGDGRVRWILDGATTVCDTAAGIIQPGQWYHLTATHDGTNAKIYMDGVLITTQPSGTSSLTDTGDIPTRIGWRYKNSSINYNDGRIGEVRVYKKALTAAQVYQNYNASKTKYLNEAPSTAPKIGPSIVYIDPLLLYYDFKNKVTYDDTQNYLLDNFASDTDTGEYLTDDVGKHKIYQADTNINSAYGGSQMFSSGTYDVSVSMWMKADDMQTNQFALKDGLGAPVGGTFNFTPKDVNPDGGIVSYTWNNVTIGSNWNFGVYNNNGDARTMQYARPHLTLKPSLGRYVKTYTSVITPPTKFKNLVSTAYTSTISGATFNDEGYFIFDGSNDHIDLQGSGISLTESDGWALEGWFRFPDPASNNTAGTWNYLFRDNISGGPVWEVGMYGTNNSFEIKDNNSQERLFCTITPNTWHFICLGQDPTGKLFLKNSNSDGSFSTQQSSGAASSGDLQIVKLFCNQNGLQCLNAHCGEIRIYDREIITPEFTVNYNATRKRYGI